MNYAVILGHQPHITIAELAAVIPGFSLVEIVQKKVALFTSSEEIDPDVIDLLGGSVLLVQCINESDLTIEDIPNVLKEETAKVKGKITFGLRCYGLPSKGIKLLYRRCKEKLKGAGRNCRYVGNERKAAATNILHNTDLLSGKHGCELVLIAMQKEDVETLWIGKTIAAQDIDWYSWLDMEKPVRDTTVGLLPPKLAQILLNFGEWIVEEMGEDNESDVLTVLDPFCGTGVIPMECLNREMDVLASDIAIKAVNGCNKNIDWLRKEEKILKKDAASTVWKQDATKPFDLKELPDVVVTETTLGPPLDRRPGQRDATKLRNDNEKLQAAFLRNAAETLPGVPIVCTWPVWMLKSEKVRLEKIWKVVEECGYKPVLPPYAEPDDPKHLSLLYRRKDQFVGREIVLLKPTK